MQLLGTVIKSTEALKDTYFEATKILIVEYNSKGAIGFVINKPFPHYLNELEEFKHTAPFPLHEGGPVDQEHLFFIHKRPDLVEGGSPVSEGWYYGGNFKQAVDCINQHTITTDHMKILIGYCGWEAGELEAEIEEGSWEIGTMSDEL